MKKVISIFLNILLLLSISFSFYLPATNAAFSCTVSPATIDVTSGSITFNINSGGNLANGRYYVGFDGTKIGFSRYVVGTLFTASGGQITVNKPGGISSGVHTITVFAQNDSNTNLCNNAKITGNVPDAGGTGYCNVKFTNTDAEFTPTTDIKFYVTGDMSTDTAMHHYILYSGSGSNGSAVKEGCDTGPNLANLTNPINLGQYSSGTYYLDVRRECNIGGLFESTACYSTFTIGPSGGGPTGSGTGTAPGQPRLTPPPCDSSISASAGCKKVSTAVGSIGTDEAGLVKSLFGVILSAAGAIAVLLIIYSGYRLMLSQGNPEQVQQARDQLIAAIVGLLFIILSLVILQFIGYDILHLPGFGT